MDSYESKKIELGYVEVTPMPTEEELAKFYSETYYSDGVTATYQSSYTEQELSQKLLRAACTVELISKNLDSSVVDSEIRALEIGSGEGFIIQSFVDKGWRATGVDFQSAPVEAMNPQVMKDFVEANPTEYLRNLINKGDKFDVIVLQNVLEHVRDPKNLMELLLTAITKNGCILVQVPNDFSDLQMLAKKQSRIDNEYWFCPPQHLTYFNEQSLNNFISSVGGKVVDGISDFPIEMYLWGNESNYAVDKTIGKHAHSARVNLDLFISQKGMDKYLDFYRSCYNVGIGRNLCAVIQCI
jgi:2-polyprenyl-3-methyl-5-hydroxy-6-metoxy-1,4-benzoquinol methylase